MSSIGVVGGADSRVDHSKGACCSRKEKDCTDAIRRGRCVFLISIDAVFSGLDGRTNCIIRATAVHHQHAADVGDLLRETSCRVCR